jgi:plastocyanin
MRINLIITAVLLSAITGWSSPAPAQDHAATVTIRNHRFEPAEIRVPAGKRITLTVINDDPTPEEFESRPMKVEKIIPGKSRAIIRIGPLKAGSYPFVGEFHETTAKGVVIAE